MDIKKFILRLLLFAAIAIPLVALNSLYAYFTKNYELTVNGNEVYVSLKKSKTHKKVKVLIIGDSVGKQLYDNDTYNGDIYSLSCNQAISMAGYYFLLNNFINTNKDSLPDRVILLVTPETFTSNLDQRFTFHYFLKPFNNATYRPYFTATVQQQVGKIPAHYLSQFPLIINTDWAPDYAEVRDTGFAVISPVTKDYLPRIKALCVERHIPFTIVPSPVRDELKKEIEGFAKNTEEFKTCGLLPEMTTYFNNVKFFPDTLFQDRIHFKKQYIPVDYLKLKHR